MSNVLYQLKTNEILSFLCSPNAHNSHKYSAV